jgi:hypothetical protein
MLRDLTGRYAASLAGGETVRAFVPDRFRSFPRSAWGCRLGCSSGTSPEATLERRDLLPRWRDWASIRPAF